jgi:diguanylate cyclase (GGDEF)-like protein
LLLLFIAAIILYFISVINYLFFHALVEGFAIIVATLIYILATRTYKYSQNSVFLFLGKSYLFVAILDLMHMLTYKGMGVFPGFGADTPTQLWIAGRFLEAASFFVVLFLKQEYAKRKITDIILSFVTVSLLLSIMTFKVFPSCFIEGKGLTNFKIISEYIIIFILFLSVYLMYLRKEEFGQEPFNVVGTAMIVTAISELSFTLYTDVYGIANMLGHLLKVISYYFIYKGVVVHGIDVPYSLISAELKEKAIKDDLTDLYNHQGMLEMLEYKLKKAKENKRSLGVLMIDLDNFKLINDRHGHLFGDWVLQAFARLLIDSIREKDVACRYGGDEFVVLMQDVDAKALAYIKKRIEANVEEWIQNNKKLKGLGISIGTSIQQPGEFQDINSLIRSADKSMYSIKRTKKVGYLNEELRSK